MTQVATWRAQFLESAAIWSGRGRPRVEGGRCVAAPGVASTGGNVIFCLGGDLPLDLRSCVADLHRSAVPTVITIGAEALGWAQVLVDGDLVCVGSSPFMHLPVERVERTDADADVRLVRPEDLAEARTVVADVFPWGPPLPAVAVPPERVGSPTWDVWGLEIDGRLMSVVTISRVGDATSIWWMSTSIRWQRRGLGRRLLLAVLSEVADGGSEHILLVASPSGEPLYRAVGFDTVEHWQQWSRPRWLLGRS